MPGSPVIRIPPSDITRSQHLADQELHFTGGLRGFLVGPSQWAIGPTPALQGMSEIGPFEDQRIRECAAALGVVVLGADEIGVVEPDIPFRIWTPLLGPPVMQRAAADTWSMRATGAYQAGDGELARLAGHVSACLRAADLHLRSISDGYNAQLRAAIRRGQTPGGRFSNLALMDVHLACHSLLAEMGAARDYMSAIAARRVGAPSRIEALSRLQDWAAKPVNRSALSDPFLVALLAASDETGGDAWLGELGEYRNLFLHREPMSANDSAKWLTLHERRTAYGAIQTITMELTSAEGSSPPVDALTRFGALHGRLARLADELAGFLSVAGVIVQIAVDRPEVDGGR